jgi:hypothetical protein
MKRRSFCLSSLTILPSLSASPNKTLESDLRLFLGFTSPMLLATKASPVLYLAIQNTTLQDKLLIARECRWGQNSVRFTMVVGEKSLRIDPVPIRSRRSVPSFVKLGAGSIVVTAVDFDESWALPSSDVSLTSTQQVRLQAKIEQSVPTLNPEMDKLYGSALKNVWTGNATSNWLDIEGKLMATLIR